MHFLLSPTMRGKGIGKILLPQPLLLLRLCSSARRRTAPPHKLSSLHPPAKSAKEEGRGLPSLHPLAKSAAEEGAAPPTQPQHELAGGCGPLVPVDLREEHDGAEVREEVAQRCEI
jgi:hypothetical protein